MDVSSAQESFGSLSVGRSNGGATSHGNDADEHALRLVYQSSSTSVYRHGRDGGVKVIHDRAPREGAASSPPSLEAIQSRIEHERRITNLLPRCLPKRRITRTAPFDGRPSFRFEWVEGVSLEEWIERDRPRRAAGDMRARLRLAVVIAKAVSDYHDASVAHNRLSTSNVIVEETSGGHCAAVLIDLSQARVLSDSDDQEEKARCNDLKDLGRILYELFHDKEQHMRDCNSAEAWRHHPDDASTDIEMDNETAAGRRKRERRATDADGVFPAYLSALLSALASSGGGGNEFGELYHTAKDVFEDLRAAVSKYDTYFPSPTVVRRAQNDQVLMHGDFFYGRKSEVSMLMQSLDAAARGEVSIVTAISGPAGIGKTSLANQIESPLKGKGSLLRVKFDQHAQQPEAILFSAIDSFLGSLAHKNDTDRLKLEQRIIDIVGPSVSILTALIPNLGAFVPCIIEEDEEDKISVPAATQQQRLQVSQYLLRSLLRALSTPKSMLVLLIDDLQWAGASLQLVQQILAEREMRYCYFIVSYRDDDALLTPRVTETLDAIRVQGVGVQTIGLGPIEKQSVVTLVSEALCLPPSLSRPLSSLLHSKTGGAALFITNFLRTLSRDGLIRFNLSTRRWEYDLQQISKTVIPPDVRQFLTMQMTKLGHYQCLALKVAACLGSNSFDLITFTKAKVANNLNLEEQLPTLAASGFIHAISPNKFMWAHDTVRQGAYELIPQTKREMFHLLIGTKILINTKSEQLEESIFDIVSQMTAGKEYLQSDTQKYEVAQLNLIAGKRALKAFQFNSAALHFSSGVQLLPNKCWEQQYDLSLNIHNCAISASYAVGDSDQLRKLLTKTLAKANVFNDRLNAYQYRIMSLKSSGLAFEAVSESLFVIGELGERLPSQQLANEALVASEFMHVKNILMNHSDNDVFCLHVMNDSHKISTMGHLRMLISSSANVQPNLGAIAIFRMVQISLEWGLCDESAFSFAMYGAFLCKTQDYEEAYRYGKVALKLMERLSLGTQDRVKARVYMIVICVINLFREPYQASLDRLLDGFHTGCRHGDLEWAFYCLQRHLIIQLHAGGNLIKLKQELISAVKKARQYGQVTAVILIVVWLSSVTELIGNASCDPYMEYLSCTEESLLTLQESQKHFAFCHVICDKQKIVRVFNGDIDGAAQYYTRVLQYPHGEVTPSTATILSAFMDGLIAFTKAQKHGIDEGQWTDVALGVIAYFSALVKSSHWNFSQKLYLLQAEEQVLKGNDALAVEKYELSITTAQKHRFIHEEGLGFERAGDYHVRMGRTNTATLCYMKAMKCFERWGAHSVAHRIAEKCRRF